jgi:hypothetical protein
MSTVGISDTIGNRMINGPSIADTSRGVVALEVSAPMTCLFCGAAITRKDHPERATFCSRRCDRAFRMARRPDPIHFPDRIEVPLCATSGVPVAWALISPEDASLATFPWSLNSNGYAWRNTERPWLPGAPRHIYLHRAVVGLVPGDGLLVDHINRDKLDNRRPNLRVGTSAQSAQNKPAIRGAHRGVFFNRGHGLWQATGQLDGRARYIGRYPTEEEAAAASRAWRIAHMPFTVEDIA